MMVASLATFLVYIIEAAEIQDGTLMLQMEFKFLLVGLVLQLFLFVSFMGSMLKLTNATKAVDGKNNRFMQILNLTFFGTLLAL